MAHRREGRGQSRPWPVSIRLQEWRNPNRTLGLTFRWLSGSIREEQVPMGLSHQDPLCVHGVFGMNPLEEVAATGSHLSPPGPCRALGDPPHWLSKTRNLRNDQGDTRRAPQGSLDRATRQQKDLARSLFQGERRHRKERRPVVVAVGMFLTTHPAQTRLVPLRWAYVTRGFSALWMIGNNSPRTHRLASDALSPMAWRRHRIPWLRLEAKRGPGGWAGPSHTDWVDTAVGNLAWGLTCSTPQRLLRPPRIGLLRYTSEQAEAMWGEARWGVVRPRGRPGPPGPVKEANAGDTEGRR